MQPGQHRTHIGWIQLLYLFYFLCEAFGVRSNHCCKLLAKPFGCFAQERVGRLPFLEERNDLLKTHLAQFFNALRTFITNMHAYWRRSVLRPLNLTKFCNQLVIQYSGFVWQNVANWCQPPKFPIPFLFLRVEHSG